MKIEQRKWTKETGWTFLPTENMAAGAQVVFLFGDTGLLKEKKYFDEINSFYPQARVFGCSTAGEIVNTEVLDNSLVATAVFFEKTKLHFVETKINQMEDSLGAGEILANALPKEDLVHVFVLSDGLNVNGSGLAKGLTNALPPHVAVTGGLAGDQARFKETLVFSGSSPGANMIVAIGFYGRHLKVGYGSMGGWDSFGPDRLVTRSKGNILFELDGQPALELYKTYLGDQARGLPAAGLLFPLSLRLKSTDANLVRTILAVNEQENSMTFAGDIPQGSYVRLMKANVERLVDGAAGAAYFTRQTTDSSPVELAILISCVGRKLVLKQRVEEEIESVKEVLGKDSSMTGFYSYGEICPVGTQGKHCELHNQTMTITTFMEER